MSSYSYSRLSTKIQEIRILTLLPGLFEDPISFLISHEPFIVTNFGHPRSVVRQEHQDSLLPCWNVNETLEGRIIYNHVNPETGLNRCSWAHPDPNFQLNDNNETYNDFKGIKPDYEALSYTWGSAATPEIAYVGKSFAAVQDVTDSPTTLALGQNLACALKYLRYTDKTRRLWIDAVCINQSDIEERGSQVSQMDKIYKFANRVVVWLGPELNNIKRSFSVLKHIGRQVEVTRNNLYGPSPDCTEDLWYDPTFILPYDEQTWQAIYDLVGLPWFHRLWILQEIQLANSKSILLCGTQEIPWYLFRRSMICVTGKQKGLPFKLHERLRHHIFAICTNTEGQSLHSLFYISRFSKCAEPVDKVYGILGLAPKIIVNKITPNYLIYYGEVYKSTLLEHIKLTSRIELFGGCNLRYPVANMPSWVPNWGMTFNVFPLWTGLAYASGFSSAHISYEQSDTLEALGLPVSTVSMVSQSSIESMSDLFGAFQNIEPKRFQNEKYVTGEPLLDAFAFTLSLCFLKERFPQDERTGLSLSEFKRILTSLSQSTEKAAETNHPYILPKVQGRKFLSTKEGYMGFGPDCALPGKWLIQLQGLNILADTINRRHYLHSPWVHDSHALTKDV